MRILGIDPGNKESAYVVYDSAAHTIAERDKTDNRVLLQRIPAMATRGLYSVVGIEMPACYGMAVGRSVFDTCLWVGRYFQQVFHSEGRAETYLLYRKRTSDEGVPSTTMHLCHTTRAKDPNIRQALIDRFPHTGGGKQPWAGTKKDPGPLYGVSKDIWAALSVAVTLGDWLKTRGVGSE